MEDRQIIALYFARNGEAIKVSSDKYGSYVKGISMSILQNALDAEECVNVTYYDYDESGNLVRITFTTDEDQITSVYSYEYNEHGERTKEIRYTYMDSELVAFSTVVYEYGIIS